MLRPLRNELVALASLRRVDRVYGQVLVRAFQPDRRRSLLPTVPLERVQFFDTDLLEALADVFDIDSLDELLEREGKRRGK